MCVFYFTGQFSASQGQDIHMTEENKELQETISNASIVRSIMMLVIITFGIGEMLFPY